MFGGGPIFLGGGGGGKSAEGGPAPYPVLGVVGQSWPILPQILHGSMMLGRVRR
jgi:hypothetical protein